MGTRESFGGSFSIYTAIVTEIGVLAANYFLLITVQIG